MNNTTQPQTHYPLCFGLGVEVLVLTENLEFQKGVPGKLKPCTNEEVIEFLKRWGLKEIEQHRTSSGS